MVGIRTRPYIWLEHRCRRFLDLHEQRIIAFRSSQGQHDGTARTYTAHPHDFLRDIKRAVPEDDHAPLLRQARQVVFHQRSPLFCIQIVLASVQLVVVIDQRRLILDAVLPIHGLGQLRECFQAGAFACSCRRASHAFLELFATCHATCHRENALHVEVEVPHIQVVHQGKLLHTLTVALHAPHHRLPALLGGVAILSTGHDHAGSQALHIPFPGTGERLVEIVHIEDLPALRGGIDAKIAQMRVTADLRLNT